MIAEHAPAVMTFPDIDKLVDPDLVQGQDREGDRPRCGISCTLFTHGQPTVDQEWLQKDRVIRGVKISHDDQWTV